MYVDQGDLRTATFRHAYGTLLPLSYIFRSAVRRRLPCPTRRCQFRERRIYQCQLHRHTTHLTPQAHIHGPYRSLHIHAPADILYATRSMCVPLFGRARLRRQSAAMMYAMPSTAFFYFPGRDGLSLMRVLICLCASFLHQHTFLYHYLTSRKMNHRTPSIGLTL